MTERTYIAIDLKSFYASVECADRGLDPLDTNLVVADSSRTEKTICLAVSPSMKSLGLPGRCRLFEVYEKLYDENRKRSQTAGLKGKSWSRKELENDPSLAAECIVAPPRMARYMEVSRSIYSIYLRHASPDDIHVYSIDEVFIDATDYMKLENLNAEEFARLLINEVLQETKITATAGIGTNLYLAKIAMDVEAKHIKPDEHGVRIASLDEFSYRRKLWNHTPLTDFWRIGHGTAEHLEKLGIRTMGELASASLGSDKDFLNEDKLFREFGINAELLIDHAWGYEPCTMKDIKEYRPSSTSVTQGQVLMSPYSYDKARIIVREMADTLALELVQKRLKANAVMLCIGYDAENLADGSFRGETKRDHYGRNIPKGLAKSMKLPRPTSSSSLITDTLLKLYDDNMDRNLTVRRVNIALSDLISDDDDAHYQPSLFDEDADSEKLEKERRLQEATLKIKDKWGKNAILRALDYTDGATQRERNSQIGGHRA
ncbi:MAG: DNA methylase [Bullifex sp.]